MPRLRIFGKDIRSEGKRGLWIFGDAFFTSVTSAVSGERRRLSKEVALFPSVT